MSDLERLNILDHYARHIAPNDPVEKLKIAQARIAELEAQVAELTGEVEWLREYEEWAGKSHLVLCEILAALNIGNPIPWSTRDTMRDIMFNAPNRISWPTQGGE